MNSGDAWVDGSALTAGISAMPRRILIDGEWHPAASGKTLPVHDPSTGEVIAAIARGGTADIDAAVAAARKAFDDTPWPRLRPEERARLLFRLADLLESRAEEFALIETLDNGKPIRAARTADIGGSIAKLRRIAGWAGRTGGETIPMGDTVRAYTEREPVGVAGLIVPWNFPLLMAVSKLSEALAAGCCTVLKPAEQTSLSAIRLGELICEAGFPDGVVNIVTGLGAEAGQALAAHPAVDKISFTGSTAVGKSLLAAAAGNLKRLTLELGGKSPSFVFADADLDRATEGVFRNIFYNAGQVCAAGSRVYVHAAIHGELTERLIAKARALRIGRGIDERTELGPLVSERQLATVSGYVDAGLAEGATLLTGGGREGETGYFMQPTVLADTRPGMKVRREEIFGPVLCLERFGDEPLEQLAREANDSPYGLSAYVFTQNLDTALRMTRLIRAGFVRVNGAGLDSAIPFGGYRQSGWGREGGLEGVNGYTELKSVSIAL